MFFHYFSNIAAVIFGMKVQSRLSHGEQISHWPDVIIAIKTNGQNPPSPALIGKNNMPAPTAVPKGLISMLHQICSIEFFCWFHSLLQSINYLNLSICRAKYALTKFEYYVMPINRESQRENSKIVIGLKFFYKKCGIFMTKNRCDDDTDCV